MLSRIVAVASIFLFVTSCAHKVKETSAISNKAILSHPVSKAWWRQFNDASLNQDIAAALRDNPDLQAIQWRAELADSLIAKARASTLPRVNLDFGLYEARKREDESGVMDPGPWQSGAGLAWEIDITGKLKAAKNAASEAKNAELWDISLARLLLTSKIAKLRTQLQRANAEIATLQEIVTLQNQIKSDLKDQVQAGVIPDAEIYKQDARTEQDRRRILEWTQMRDLLVVQLRTLRGGSPPKNTQSEKFLNPQPAKKIALHDLLASHPKILAAAARVRQAFQLQQAAELDLLPSFQINLLASGTQKSLVERFQLWSLKAGPSLRIPIYDPARMSKLQMDKAKAKIAAENYKSTVLQVLKEIDSARINLAGNKAQLASLRARSNALQDLSENASEEFSAGLISQAETLKRKTEWLNATRDELAIRQSILSAHIELIKATGGQFR